MRALKSFFVILTVVLISGLLLCCDNETNESFATDNEVAFAISISSLNSTSMLKSDVVYNLSEADKIVLTIMNSDGSATKYTSSEVKIQQMNGVFYTQKIVLKTGNYKLTEFLILDEADSTIFATPLLGSIEAQNITSPLPFLFSVAKDVTTTVNVEVLSTEKKKPEDFGYNSFSISEVKTFGFMIGVSDLESDKLLSAKITVSNGTYSYTKNIDSIANNVVTVKDGFSDYTLTVEKAGYETYTHTYSISSLKMFKVSVGNLPMLIDLVKNVTDIDGNIYHTVVIGTQVWMVENLKTTKYNDGTAIPLVTENSAWSNLTTPGYCWYDNDEEMYKKSYGALYNWYTVNTGKLAPTGWHIPSDEEWTVLMNYLGGADAAGGKLKETGAIHWWTPNTGATNETGFTALPGGDRGNNGYVFTGIGGFYGIWWCSTESNSNGIMWRLFYDSNTLYRQEAGKHSGFSIRCLRD